MSASTALSAGKLAWIVLHAIGEAPMGLLPMRLYVMGTIVGLIEFPLAAVAGAKFYRET